MLAMLNPDAYGIPGATPLRIIGDGQIEGMLLVQSGRPESGKGAYNRRTNVSEGLLSDWQESEDTCVIELRWHLARLEWMHFDNHWTTTVKDVIHACMSIEDEIIEGAWADGAQQPNGSKEGARPIPPPTPPPANDAAWRASWNWQRVVNLEQ